MARLSLLFGVHAHQPAGNFPEVLEHAHDRCYRPFLEILHRHPDFRFAVHFSGPLLDYLVAEHPEDMQLLDDMVRRGQVEMFGAGDTEPVLASIPDRDRRGQIAQLSRKLAARFGHEPRGAWLTERVWETTVVPALAESGIRYVTVDDYHFLCTGRTPGELDSYFTTEEDGHRLDLFPISEKLRYCFPFAPADEAVGFLERSADEGRAAAIYFDDIEKFGIWPETHEWVYGRGWLEQFVRLVLASQKIVTGTFQDFHETHRTRGIVYLPTTSYIEMNEWTLPAPAAERFAALVKQEKDLNRFDEHKPFLRGGMWKNFLSRYPEANWMHKRMVALSKRVDAVAATPAEKESLRSLLYMAQANDAYWHGLFGGVYLPHLRRGIYRSLVLLEARLDAIAPRADFEVVDLDHDGCDEAFLRSDDLQAVVRLDGRAAICELDAYALGQNFADTLRRHAEHYHRAALEKQKESGKKESGIASPHERFKAKLRVTAEDVKPDPRGRHLFVDSWFTLQPTEMDTYHPIKGSDPLIGGPRISFEAQKGGVSVRKTFAVDGPVLTVEYEIESAVPIRFETELDLAMPCCDGYSGRFIHEGEILGGFGSLQALDEASTITLDDRHMNGSVRFSASAPVRLSAQPYYTVSQSEDGLEKIMQAVALKASWMVAGKGSMTFTLEPRPGEAMGLREAAD